MLPSLAGGGAERAAVQVLNGLDDGHWDRSMYLFRREGPYLADVEPRIAVTAGGGGSRLGRWRELRDFLRATRPDVIMVFLSYFSVLAAAKAARIPARIVFNQQNPNSEFLADGDFRWAGWWRRPLFSLVARLAYTVTDRVVAISTGVAEDLVTHFGLSPTRVTVIHNPVDLDRIQRESAEPLDPAHQARWSHPVIVAAGRLAEQKNYPLLIDALAVLRERVPAHLFILGQGPLETSLRQYAAARGLEHAVIFCGFQSNPWKYIARADVFALTSRYEGFGNVMAEAMACGVPVVATTSQGTRDIVRDGVDGFLVDAHEPAAVAVALERVLSDAALRQRLSAGARGGAARFALPAIVEAYGRALDGVLA